MRDTKHSVDAWITLLTCIDLAETGVLEAVVFRIPVDLVRSVGDQGGPLIREKILAPALATAERDGIIEWTGQYSADGQKIWRSLLWNSRDRSVESDKT